MNKTTFKSALKYWQEIIFIIALGALIFGITMNISVAFQQVGNIVAYCIFVSLLICLISQLFWKNSILGIVLSGIFGLASFYMAFGWLVDKEAYEVSVFRIFSIILFVGLAVTAGFMLFKHITALTDTK